jgi:exonuclease VII large subunit
VTKEERAVLGISQIAQGDPVKIQLSDGSFDAVVTGTRKKEGEAYGEDKISD